jgi:hypothetical protein
VGGKVSGCRYMVALNPLPTNAFSLQDAVTSENDEKAPGERLELST